MTNIMHTFIKETDNDIKETDIKHTVFRVKIL